MRDIKAIIRDMTLEEKAGLCSGQDFWHLKAVERLGVPGVMVSDGPHGLRKQDLSKSSDHLGINDSISAVCFPSACGASASFDRELLTEVGALLGEECQAEDVSVLLGPAVNIKRSPLCGRNFEYYSEDPHVAGQLAAAVIKGVQSKNVGVSVKHYAANNQEYHRMNVSAEADERTLREIYLAAFETAVKEAKPWTVMCGYNKINGEYASEDHWLLTEVLRDEWGFDGCVVSDWGAVNDRVKGLAAGLDIEMPTSGGVTDALIVKAVRDGSLDESVLDTVVERILNLVFKYADNRIQAVFDRDAHHEAAVKAALECAVLLKNEDGALPLKTGSNVAFIGEFAKKPRFQGGGSSHINPSKIDNALDSTAGRAVITYAAGFPADKDEEIAGLIEEAVESAKGKDAAVIFAGLPDIFESEGYDREHMRLPLVQNKLIEAVAAVQPNTVVVLHNGSPVEIPWIGKVKAVLEMYLAGQGAGRAAADLLFGAANPSGKLAETFPLKLSDNPSFLYFPGDGKTAEYREGVFIGYRYYDKKEMDVLFPFGHGLSYTTFEYSNLRLSNANIKDTETLTVSVDVANTGGREGKETVQLYVSDHTNTAVRPLKELKGFAKLSLKPGEKKTAEFTLSKRAFAWYNEAISDWYCASGEYEILIGASSRDIRLSAKLNIESTQLIKMNVTQKTLMEDLLANPKTAGIIKGYIENQPLFSQGESDAASAVINSQMALRMMLEMPLCSIRMFGQISEERLNRLIDELNSQIDG
ncbi:MAG: glycoside hydrolase family 3 C-terminal domain-containing protein [Clostridiales bacterium]|jgi:beta-glucosidase|nr:glycoside hydrolase family 3 C-terminal domain-containing protein [Clostridiales bacterium]